MHATGEKQNRLRGKAFECMSLLGESVGKEKFLPDAKEAISAMMNVQGDADELQREYIVEASQRICTCLKGDFACFLPALLPSIFKSLELQSEDVAPVADASNDDGYVTVSSGNGKLMKVSTAKLEEAEASINMLWTFCEEMEGGYFDWVQPTAQALLPYLSSDDDLACVREEARGSAYQTWALLIKCARLGAK